MAKTSDLKANKSTQDSLLVAEIKDGIVVMRDGSLRAVILASSINFDLMSQRERDGVELAYQGFINSLHFPVQIQVRSQKIDLDKYIERLEQLHTKQDNELLALLMEDYIANIRSLVEEVNIMDKQFYVVVPLFPKITDKAGFVKSLKNILSPQPQITVTDTQFEQYKLELSQRVQLVSAGLTQMGVRAIPLNSQELIELYYTAYNPDTAPNQKLIEASQIQGATVTKGQNPTAGPSAGGTQ